MKFSSLEEMRAYTRENGRPVKKQATKCTCQTSEEGCLIICDFCATGGKTYTDSQVAYNQRHGGY